MCSCSNIEKKDLINIDIISCLLVDEQNNKLLLKNHEAHPTGTTPFPEVNASRHDLYGKIVIPVVHAHMVIIMLTVLILIVVAVVIIRTHISTSSGKMLKRMKKRVKVAKPMKILAIIVEEKMLVTFFAELDGKIDHLIGDGSVK
ncbi:unnamed protein product [Vicia faba]|uniref:Uncharacterized protein n=1 Tax=Vicia faba TaxID=3906 RepID=A0AAV1A321_VICFA|nr:unnamed protein product [Vicia faba]